MKRKLDDNGEPAIADNTSSQDSKSATTNAPTSFTDLGLDPRLLQAIAEQKYHAPTLVQQKAIPAALDGQDVLAKAKTGSGKTAAYLLPVLQAILKRKATLFSQSDSTNFTSALILVPTRELANQVHSTVEQLSAFCAKDISAVKLSDKVSPAVQRALLSNSPDIVISTPAKAWSNVTSSDLSVDKLTHLVLDEADLVLSYGYEEDLQSVARSLPKGVQTILMSATLTSEIDTLKGIFCRNPAVLDLEEPEEDNEGVTQYYVKCAEDEKFLLTYIIYKLRLIKGKSIIFVADIDRCYRLKLFFEQFGIRACILNSELPVNSRIHVVEEFNKNVYDIIIASDEHEVLGDEEEDHDEEDGDDDKKQATNAPAAAAAAAGAEENDGDSSKAKNKRSNGGDDRPKKKQRRSKEYGVSRGIDFKNVACVVNFDLPTTAKSYTHRIGRTARAGQTGMALSFVIPEEQYRKHMPTTLESTEHDEKILKRIAKQQGKKGKQLKPYNFDSKQVDAFRYRMNDALRAVTRIAIREARTRELRQELLKSDKLKRHFEENPGELHHLRHDGELRSARTQTHLKHVPEYLLPADAQAASAGGEAAVGFVPFKRADRRERKGRGRSGNAHKGKTFRAGRKADPLKSFKARPKRK